MASDLSVDKMDMKNGSMDSMHMTFYFGSDATILFSSWKISTWQGMLWSCVIILILAFLYEGLKVLRLNLLKYGKVQQKREMSSQSDDELLLVSARVGRLSRRTTRMILLSIQTLLHAVQVVLGYWLMLVVMTYNAWLFITIVVGAAIGYLVFNYRTVFAEEIPDPCH